MQWKKPNGWIITTGSSEYNDREYAVFDPRNLQKPLTKKILDTNSHVMWTYLDDISNLFFVTNKGSTRLQILYYSQDGETTNGLPELIPLGHHDCKSAAQSIYFMSKRVLDSNKNELQRALRFTGKAAEFISFKLPRKKEGSDADLYPPIRGTNPSMNFSQWSSGQNSAPVMVEFDHDYS